LSSWAKAAVPLIPDDDCWDDRSSVDRPPSSGPYHVQRLYHHGGGHHGGGGGAVELSQRHRACAATPSPSVATSLTPRPLPALGTVPRPPVAAHALDLATLYAKEAPPRASNASVAVSAVESAYSAASTHERQVACRSSLLDALAKPASFDDQSHVELHEAQETIDLDDDARIERI
jgi:hypothetical protein